MVVVYPNRIARSPGMVIQYGSTIRTLTRTCLGRVMKFAHEQAFLLLIVAIVGSLLFGITLGLWLGHPPPPPPPTTPTGPTYLPSATPIASPTPDASQISVILLAVDALNNPRPHLEACWLITFKPDTPEYYLLGIPPTTTVALSNSPTTSVRELHDIDVAHKLNTLFVRDAVRTLLPGINKPKAVVVFDRAMVIQAIDLLGGLTLAGQYYSGEAALVDYETLPPDSPERLERQTAIVLGLLRAARDRGYSPAGLVALLNLGQTWYPDYETLQNLAQEAPAFQLAEPPFDQDQFIPFLFETPDAP